MINRPTVKGLLFYIAALGVLLLARPVGARQVQGERTHVRITAVDSAAFPTVKVRVLTTTAGSGPVEDLSRLVLRENGVPIPEATAAQVPVGVDVALVVDANTDFLLFDDNSGLSRRDQLAAGIARFAEQFMNPDGLDRVSIIVPDETGTGAAFLLTDAARPGDVAAGFTSPSWARTHRPRRSPTPPACLIRPMALTSICRTRKRPIRSTRSSKRKGNRRSYPTHRRCARTARIRSRSAWATCAMRPNSNYCWLRRR